MAASDTQLRKRYPTTHDRQQDPGVHVEEFLDKPIQRRSSDVQPHASKLRMQALLHGLELCVQPLLHGIELCVRVRREVEPNALLEWKRDGVGLLLLLHHPLLQRENKRSPDNRGDQNRRSNHGSSSNNNHRSNHRQRKRCQDIPCSRLLRRLRHDTHGHGALHPGKVVLKVLSAVQRPGQAVVVVAAALAGRELHAVGDALRVPDPVRNATLVFGESVFRKPLTDERFLAAFEHHSISSVELGAAREFAAVIRREPLPIELDPRVTLIWVDVADAAVGKIFVGV